MLKKARKKNTSPEKSPNVEDMPTKKSKKSTGSSADALLKTTKNMKPPFKPPLGELVDSSESSGDESVLPVKTTKKKTPQKKSPTVDDMPPKRATRLRLRLMLTY